MLEEIIDEKFKKQIIFLLNNIWTGKSDMYFPLQNSINIEKKYIYKLKNFNYIFYKKNTQETKRAALFLFLDKNGNNTSVIILKDFTIYKIEILCSDEYYQGSIFDISYNEETICIYDTFSICGQKINKYTFSDRIGEADTFIHNTSKCNIQLNIVEYFNDINNCKDITENEEIFMIPNNLPIITGINYSCFKWKPCNLITFSLKAKKEKDDILMYSTIFKNDTLFAKIHYSDPEGKKYIKSIKNLEDFNDNCIIDFNISDGNARKMIDIIKVNTYKTIPTTVRTIEKILLVKQENITIEDITNI
tara:strand:- start:200 stop:1114 length:915 start_codon:yes stop_codon:yes gene_type:complete